MTRYQSSKQLVRRYAILLVLALFVMSLFGNIAFAEPDTTWQTDYDYQLDTETNHIVLKQYKGDATDLTVPATAIIDGQVYHTTLSEGHTVANGFLTGTDVKSLSFESGVSAPANATALFAGSNVKSVDISNLDMNNTVIADEMFMDCYALTSITAGTKDLSGLMSCKEMFRNCTVLPALDLSGWNPAIDCNTAGMIQDAANLKSLNISGFSATSSATQTAMFKGTTAIESLTLGNDWRFTAGSNLDHLWSKDGGTTYYTAEELIADFPGAGTYVRSLDEGWSLSLTFFDSTVGNGTTPLDHIDWDASDGGYEKGTPRTIRVRIHYRNPHLLRDYGPGELKIRIPNLMYGQAFGYGTTSTSQLDWSVVQSANDNSHTGFPWTFAGRYGNPRNQALTHFDYTNEETYGKDSSIEGSIDIDYTLTPKAEWVANYQPAIEKYDDECTHTYNQTLTATLLDLAESNSITFDYTRTYSHPWQLPNFKLSKTAALTTDVYEDTDADYYWVTYDMSAQTTDGVSGFYPYLGFSEIYIEDAFPDGCLIRSYFSNYQYDAATNKIHLANTNENSGSRYFTRFLVGYPKADYEGESEITNTATLYGIPTDASDPVELSTSTVTVNIADLTTKDASLYRAQKKSSVASTRNRDYYYMSNGGVAVQWRFHFDAMAYLGKNTLTFTDEKMQYYSREKQTYVDLPAHYYNFTELTFYGMGTTKSYPMDIYIKRAGQNDYQLYKTATTVRETHRFGTKDVVGVKLVIRDVDENVRNYNDVNNAFTLYANYHDMDDLGFEEGATSQKLYNYATFHGKTDSGIEKTIDLESSTSYSRYDLIQPELSGSLGKAGIKEPIQRGDTEDFAGREQIVLSLYSKSNPDNGAYMATAGRFDEYDAKNAIRHIRIYDLLPQGMSIVEPTAEALTLFDNAGRSAVCYKTDGTSISSDELLTMLRENTTFTKTTNYRQSGRTLLQWDIDLSEEPIFLFTTDLGRLSLVLDYDYTVPYDAVLDYGKSFTNLAYMTGDPMMTHKEISDLQRDEYDIDNDGNTTESLIGDEHTVNLTIMESPSRDLKNYVKTDRTDEFVVGRAIVGPGQTYLHRLRVRNGQTPITNLVIYDVLEDRVYDPAKKDFVKVADSKEAWNGGYLGIDTTHDTHTKGYLVKVYYATTNTPSDLYIGGAISSDWKELTDSTDKSTVKALAFEYLDAETGKPAVIEPNSILYPIIMMKAPQNVDAGVYAKNAFYAKWDDINIATGEKTPITLRSAVTTLQLTDRMNVNGSVKWTDDTASTRPDNVTIVLLRNDEPYRSQEIATDGDRSFMFENLPIKDNQDELYHYSVLQVPGSIENYETVYSDNAGRSEIPKAGYYHVINTYKAPPAPEMCTLTYDLNGGSYNGSTENIVETHPKGSKAVAHEAPTREGYTFLYWEGSRYYPGDLIPVDGDHTLTAIWEQNKGTDEDPAVPTPGNTDDETIRDDPADDTDVAQPKDTHPAGNAGAVKKAAIAKTGDTARLATAQALALAGLLVALVAGCVRRKKQF